MQVPVIVLIIILAHCSMMGHSKVLHRGKTRSQGKAKHDATYYDHLFKFKRVVEDKPVVNEDKPVVIEDKPVVNVMTLGDVNHGKTTLTAALTSVLADADHPAIDVASINDARYEAHLGASMFCSHVEYESHTRHYKHTDCIHNEDIMKTLIAVPLDAAILVVSAADGPTIQTEQQIQLAEQVGVPSMVVFINKCDIVDTQHIDVVKTQTRNLLTRFDDVQIINGSALGALNGEKEWEDSIKELAVVMDSSIAEPVKSSDKPFLMPVMAAVELVIEGQGYIAMGRIEQGNISVGDEVEVTRYDAVTTTVTEVTMLHGFGSAVLPDVNIVHKGYVLAKPGSIRLHNKFIAEVYNMPKLKLLQDVHYHFWFWDDVTTVRGKLNTAVTVAEKHGQVTVTLFNTVALQTRMTFRIRLINALEILAIGVVTDIIV